MQLSKTSLFGLGAVLAVMMLCSSDMCQAQNSSFGSGRLTANIIFEPTLSFIRQNLRLVNSYVALMRSIMVGAYERPLITSTDPPVSQNNHQPSPKVPPMDLPKLLFRRKWWIKWSQILEQVSIFASVIVVDCNKNCTLWMNFECPNFERSFRAILERMRRGRHPAYGFPWAGPRGMWILVDNNKWYSFQLSHLIYLDLNIIPQTHKYYITN